MLELLARKLKCPIRSDNNHITVSALTPATVKQVLTSNGFRETNTRHGRWIKGSLWIQYDEETGEVYIPSV